MGIEEEWERMRDVAGVKAFEVRISLVFRFMVPRRPNLWLFVIDSARGSQRVMTWVGGWREGWWAY